MRTTRVRDAFVRWASQERGALFYVPCLLGATAIALLGIHFVPRGQSLYTRVTAARVAIGPWYCGPGADAAREAFLGGLRQGFSSHGDLALVDSERVLRQLSGALQAGLQQPPPPADLLRALRPLNAHLLLIGRIDSLPHGFGVTLAGYEARGDRQLLALEVQGASARDLGRAVADSVRVALQQPHPVSGVALRSSNTEP